MTLPSKVQAVAVKCRLCGDETLGYPYNFDINPPRFVMGDCRCQALHKGPRFVEMSEIVRPVACTEVVTGQHPTATALAIEPLIIACQNVLIERQQEVETLVEFLVKHRLPCAQQHRELAERLRVVPLREAIKEAKAAWDRLAGETS